MEDTVSRQTSDLVRDWFQLRDPELNVNELDEDFDLIENRVLDSLQFMEFLLFIEELSGIPVNFDTITLDDFRSIRAIESNLLAREDRGEEVIF